MSGFKNDITRENNSNSAQKNKEDKKKKKDYDELDFILIDKKEVEE